MRSVVEYRGKVYKSKAEACKVLGVAYGSLHGYCAREKVYTEEALDHLMNLKEKRKRYAVTDADGNIISLRKACKDAGISYELSKITMRNSDIKAEEAMKVAEDRIENSGVEYNGIKYKNKREACKILGIKYNTVRNMTHDGYSFTEALNYIISSGKYRPHKNVEYKGAKYRSAKSACRELGINYDMYKKIKKKYPEAGFEKIVSMISDKKESKKFYFGGTYFKGIVYFCNLVGCKCESLGWYRKRHNEMSTEEAVTNYLKHLGIILDIIGDTYICRCRQCNKIVYLSYDKLGEFLIHGSDELCKQHEILEAS